MHDTPAVTVTARNESRWRCGTRFTASPQSFPAGYWSEEELDRLRGDAVLVVSVHGEEPDLPGGEPPTLTSAHIAWLRALTPTDLDRLAELDRPWIDRLIAVTNLGAEQVDRLVDLESDGVQALLFPTTPTVQAVLDTALSALREATPGEVREFFRTMADDPEIAAKIESTVDRQERLIAAIAGMEIEPGVNATKAGIPTVAALEALVGFDITSDERDAAWEEFRKAAKQNADA